MNYGRIFDGAEYIENLKDKRGKIFIFAHTLEKIRDRPNTCIKDAYIGYDNVSTTKAHQKFFMRKGSSDDYDDWGRCLFNGTRYEYMREVNDI